MHPWTSIPVNSLALGVLLASRPVVSPLLVIVQGYHGNANRHTIRSPFDPNAMPCHFKSPRPCSSHYCPLLFFLFFAPASMLMSRNFACCCSERPNLVTSFMLTGFPTLLASSGWIDFSFFRSRFFFLLSALVAAFFSSLAAPFFSWIEALRSFRDCVDADCSVFESSLGLCQSRIPNIVEGTLWPLT